MTLDAHADFLLSMELLINQVCHRAALRWGMKPTQHPLHERVSRAAKKRDETYTSPLSILFAAEKIDPNRLEKVDNVRQSPQWVSPIEVRIVGDKNRAMMEEASDDAPVKTYSDGSGLEGRIGAAAVMFRWHGPGLPAIRTLRMYLGTEDQQTVYVGELSGEFMALQPLLTTEAGRRALQRPRSTSTTKPPCWPSRLTSQSWATN